MKIKDKILEVMSPVPNGGKESTPEKEPLPAKEKSVEKK